MIEITDLTKTFGASQVLDGVSLEVQRGRVYGLVGPNGAGKTTLIKIMMGFLLPTGGRVFIDGQDVHQHPRIKSQVGYVADYQNYYPGFSVNDMVRFYRGTFENWNEERFAELRRVFDLPDKRTFKNFSKGMRTQLALLLNLSLMPNVLILDEPTSGLDPVLRRQVLGMLVDEVARNGTTVFVATHNLNELERTCDQIGMIHQGRILFDENLEDMKQKVRKIQVAFADGLPPELAKRPDVLKVEQQGRVYGIVMRENSAEMLAELKKHDPLLLETIDMSLEDIFIYRMGGLGYEFSDIIAQ
ncbi:MAG: ABC transporter ATP-binding protein [Eubacteriales bacterium]|nr:ABC transporter ATP-binding protein [Bacillota bacterium]MBV1728586.1 ABC transporter ATP-binding protein [Desulforudis sp.]MDP3050205.1 ABC transporter ATP-binding protein [Eubacteriales bacterium]MDQ7790415.1 ABC transporter ATP-binding protein [Clostridia bacterium]MBU4553602.1 ABC transporter ATP-binding protein [Bacillota bacterium]